jgi:hypothetical protein
MTVRTGGKNPNIAGIGPAVLNINPDVTALTELYLKTVFKGTSRYNIRADAEHVAFATIYDIRHLISFNYRHLLNIDTMDALKGINLTHGYGNMVEISTPGPFIIGGGT